MFGQYRVRVARVGSNLDLPADRNLGGKDRARRGEISSQAVRAQLGLQH